MTLPTLGVVIVTFNAADVILDCLESLLVAKGVQLRIVIVDNASTDATVATLRDWAAGRVPYAPPDDMPFALTPCPKPVALQPAMAGASVAVPRPDGHDLTLIETGLNGGFAAGVNRGLAHLARQTGTDRFWILNPDSVVPPATPRAFATEPGPKGGFSLMGGRVIYLETPDQIQIDGGLIDWRSGVTHNKNQYLSPASTPAPDPAGFDFIMGASMVASRAFYAAAGPLAEDYFLYYEEVDWALRRGDLALAYCPGGVIYHRAGSAIGSPSPGRTASVFSLYFKHRGRLRFIRRFRKGRLPGALAYSLAKAAQLLLKGEGRGAWTILLASVGGPPPREVRARLSPQAAALAFRRGSARGPD